MSEKELEYHKSKLEALCRLCCATIDDNERCTKKLALAKHILKAFEIDIEEDNTWIHPDKVCTSCSRKLERFKQKYKTGRPKPAVNIAIFEFVAHGPACQACGNVKGDDPEACGNAKGDDPEACGSVKGDDPEACGSVKGDDPEASVDSPPVAVKQVDILQCANDGRQAGYVATITETFVTLTKLNDDGTSISHYGKIYKECLPILVVGCRDVSKQHIQDNMDTITCAKMAMDRLLKWKVCPGNKNFVDVIQSRREACQGIAVFRDIDRNIEIAREESGDVIRNVNCRGFVPKSMRRCEICHNYAGVLRKLRSRSSQENNVQPGPSSHARNDQLSPEQLRAKLSSVQEDRRSLKRQVDSLQQRLCAAIERDAVELPQELSEDLSGILSSTKDLTDQGLQKVFWEQQEQCLKRSKHGFRWHPAIIRLCIAIHAKSPGAYECLKRSGVLKLPSARTLRDYTFFTKPSSGFQAATVQRIADDCKLQEYPEEKRSVVLVFDEIHIRQGLVYAGDSDELLGWTDLGDVNNEIAEIGRGDKEPALANHILCFMVRGLFISLNQVFAFFPCTGFTSSQIFMTAWEAILVLEAVGFRVRAITCDGATANRKFYRLHGVSGDEAVSYVRHPVRENAKVYFMCDVPHLIKTTRNNFENSGWNSKSRVLEYNNQSISWVQLVQLYEEHHPKERNAEEGERPIAIFNPIPKITPQHLYLTPSMRMKVKLATQVLSRSVKDALEMSPKLSQNTISTQIFIGNMDRFFDCLNVRRLGQDIQARKPELAPYRDGHDWRLNWLENDFLRFLNDWEMQSQVGTNQTKQQKAKRCISKETLEGLRITVRSFVALTRELLQEEHVEYVLSSKFSQDPLEQYFSKQRSLGGNKENPDVLQFGYNHLKLIVAGSSAVQASAHGNTRPELREEVLLTPIARR